MTEREALRILHVEPGCSDGQLRQAYTDLVKVWHPDRFQSDARLRQKAERTLQGINAAYAVLQHRTAESEAAPPFVHERPDPRARSEYQPVYPPTARVRGPNRRVLPAVIIGSLIGVALAVFFRSSPRPSLSVAAPAVSSTAADVELPRDRQPPGVRVPGARPESGTELRPASDTGTGQLSMLNDTRRDAVVALIGDTESDRVFFVRRGEKVTLLDVKPGTYRVRVMLGDDWTGRAFQRPAGDYEQEELVTVVSRQEAHNAKPAGVVIDDRQNVRPIPAFRVD